MAQSGRFELVRGFRYLGDLFSGIARLALLVLLSSCGLVSYDLVGSGANGDAGPAGDGGDGDGDGGTMVVAPVSIDVPVFATTSTIPEAVPGSSFTITPTSSEPWLVLMSARLKSSSANAPALAYNVNGAQQGVGGSFALDLSQGPWQHFYYFDDGQAKTFDFTLATRTGMSEVSDLTVVAIPLPEGAAPQYVAADAATAVSDGPFLPMFIATQGDYVVLTVAVAEDTSGGDLEMFLSDSNGDRWPQDVDLVQGRLYWQSFFFARLVTVPATGLTLSWNANTLGAPSSNVTYSRMLAFRADAFATTSYAESLARQTFSLDSAEVAAQATVASSQGTGTALVIQNVIARVNTAGTWSRMIGFTIDGDSDIQDHTMDHLNHSPSYTQLALVTAAGGKALEAAVRSPDLQPLDVLEATILALELP